MVSASNTERATAAETTSTWTSMFDTAYWINPLDMFTSSESGTSTAAAAAAKTASASTSDGSSASEQSGKEDELRIREQNEVLGWTLDAAARGVITVGAAVFVSSELLRKANEAASCNIEYDGDEWMDADDCDGRVYGFKPSSILTNIVMISGISTAVAMPLVGSLIDHTAYRKAVGSGSAAAMAVVVLVQMLAMDKFWFVAATLQVVVAICYTIHLCAVYAYLPELTSDGNQMVAYTSRFVAAQYGSSVIFLVCMVGILLSFNRNERFETIQMSQTVVFCAIAVFMGYPWMRLFQPRPPSQKIPPGKTLLSAGFWKIFKTSRTILLHHNAIKWFLVSAACTEAATTTFSTIAITYMTEILGFTAQENGTAILLLLIFGVPGTKLASWLTSKVNPIRSLQACLVVWILTIIAASTFLRNPERKYLAYVFACIWGLAIGWVHPTEKALYVTIIPRGQEAELMGTYICACQIISWLPPLVFSVMNEAGFPMWAGLFSLTAYFSSSVVILFWMGDYEEATTRARLIDEGKITFAATPVHGFSIASCYDHGPSSSYDDYEIYVNDEPKDHEDDNDPRIRNLIPSVTGTTTPADGSSATNFHPVQDGKNIV